MITQDDIVYMIVTDRFADGDSSNNGTIDRSDLNRRHGGDLLGILQHLPYLKELGVTALWITPVYANPPDGYHGYHPVDFETVDSHLGSPELGPPGSPEVLRRFSRAVHEAGFKLILDVVVNHTAREHPWLRERPDWFNADYPSPEKVWLWGLPDLDHSNVEVNAYFTRNVLIWMLEAEADGIRIDATRHVEQEFWSLFKVYAHGLLPDCTVIGEIWDVDPRQVAPYQRSHGFDSMFDFPLQMAAADVFARDWGFYRIARPELSDAEPPGVLNLDSEYRNAYQLITFLENHDTPRFYYLAGDNERPDEALARLELASIFLLTSRGIPQIYYGAELGLDGGPHPDNRRDMPWQWLHERADAPEGRRARQMLAFTQRLIRIRRESPALRYGLQVTLYVTATVYAYLRAFPDDPRIVVLNNGTETIELSIPIHANPRLPEIVRDPLQNGAVLVNALDSGDRATIVDGALHVRIPPRAGAIYHNPLQPFPAPAASQTGHPLPRSLRTG